MSKPICTVMVGLPGLGKSTLVESQRKIYDNIDMNVFVYSTDAYIENVASAQGKTYTEMFSDTIAEATENMENFLQYAIEDGHDVIWDQTNLGVGKRRKIINRMKQAGYQIRGECILPPDNDYDGDKEEWTRRLANRPGKTIPQNILTNMIESFIVPSVDEEFDMITFYNMHGALLGIDNNAQKNVFTFCFNIDPKLNDGYDKAFKQGDESWWWYTKDGGELKGGAGPGAGGIPNFTGATFKSLHQWTTELLSNKENIS